MSCVNTNYSIYNNTLASHALCAYIIILSEANLLGLLESVCNADSVGPTTTVTQVAVVPIYILYRYNVRVYRPEIRKLAEYTYHAKFNNTLRHVCVYGNRGIGIV